MKASRGAQLSSRVRTPPANTAPVPGARSRPSCPESTASLATKDRPGSDPTPLEPFSPETTGSRNLCAHPADRRRGVRTIPRGVRAPERAPRRVEGPRSQRQPCRSEHSAGSDKLAETFACSTNLEPPRPFRTEKGQEEPT